MSLKEFIKECFNKSNQAQSKETENGNKIIFSKNVSLDVNSCSHLNTVIFANNGSGIMKSFIEPNLYQNSDDTSFVIADPDGEIWKATHEKMEEMGYDVVYFNPVDPDPESRYNRYNPINYCHSEKDAVELAEVLYKNTKDYSNKIDPFFDLTEMTLLKMIILYMCSHFTGIDDGFADNITRLLNQLIIQQEASRFGNLVETKDDVFADYYKWCCEHNADEVYKKAYDTVNKGTAKTKQTALLDLAVKMSFMASGTLKELTRVDNCKIYTLFNRKTIIYIGFNTMERSYNILSVLLLKECIKEITDRFERCGKRPYHVRFILKDAAVLKDIEKIFPDFSKVLPLAESRGMSFQVIIQNYELARSIYGIKKCEEVFENLYNTLILGVNNTMTAEYVLSNMTEEYISAAAGSITTQIEETGQKPKKVEFPILRPQEIRYLGSDRALILLHNFVPIFDHKYKMKGEPVLDSFILSCTNKECNEPTKRINGTAEEHNTISKEYTYTCKYLEKDGMCPLKYNKK